MANGENLSIHLVNATQKQLESISPNVYLNLARLLSPAASAPPSATAATWYTLVFPGDISQAITFVSCSDMSTKLSETISLGNYKIRLAHSRPIVSIVGNGDSNRMAMYPSALDKPNSLSPLLIPHNHPRWCSERFVFSISRGENWDVCLWQVWLDAFGRVGKIGIGISGDVTATNRVAEERVLRSDFAVHTPLPPPEIRQLTYSPPPPYRRKSTANKVYD